MWVGLFLLLKRQKAEGRASELLMQDCGMSVLHNMQIYMYSFPFDPIQNYKAERSIVLLGV